MDILLVVLILADLYLIVYYRLLVGHWREKASGKKETGFLVAVSFPSRDGLPDEARKYYWRYWCAVAALVVLLVVGTAYRLPALREAVRSLT
jgi:hypothetical protein